MKKIKIAIMILIGLLIILSIIMLSLKKDHNMANEGTEEAEKQDEEIALPNNSTQETNTYLFFAIEEIAKQALENNTQSNQKVLYNMVHYLYQTNLSCMT